MSKLYNREDFSYALNGILAPEGPMSGRGGRNCICKLLPPHMHNKHMDMFIQLQVITRQTVQFVAAPVSGVKSNRPEDANNMSLKHVSPPAFG